MRRTTLLVLGCLLVFAPSVGAAPIYDVLFDVRLVPTEHAARVAIKLGSGSEKVRQLSLRVDPERHFDFQCDGECGLEEGRMVWTPPTAGGELRYTFLIDHLRDERSYDARSTKSWALFRGDDLVPPTRTRVTDGARSRSRLRLRVPEGWSRALPFPLVTGGFYTIEKENRGFDRPTGWMLAGELGAVRENVSGTEVAIAGPVSQSVRRQDMLALLRWTMPEMKEVLGELPPRLLVVGAGDPMWRGGLSGPASVYVHARRPLIAEDGTSPLLHEVMHTMLGVRPGRGGDWIVEGLAEYYSTELLRRSGTISAERSEAIFERMRERGRKAPALEVKRTSGDVVARAVTALRGLDGIIREHSEEQYSLDDVTREIARQRGEMTTDRLGSMVLEVTGVDVSGFLQVQIEPR